MRWKIEQFHRGLKQLTGVESCQCREGWIQRSHIHCALPVWNFLRRERTEAEANGVRSGSSAVVAVSTSITQVPRSQVPVCVSPVKATCGEMLRVSDRTFLILQIDKTPICESTKTRVQKGWTKEGSLLWSNFFARITRHYSDHHLYDDVA